MTNRANCPGLSEITVRDFPKSLSATYRNRCPGLSETRTFIESFNGSLRDELLNEELFDSLADARRKLAVWRYDYNNVRPHSSLGNRTQAQARRAFLHDGSVTPDALVPVGQHEYQTGRLSL